MDDFELGLRLWKMGVKFQYLPDAVACELSVKGWRSYLFNDGEAFGKSEVLLCRKYPDYRQRSGLFAGMGRPLFVASADPQAVALPGHETIVHAGRGEVEFCWQAVEQWPAGLFDVQIAAALVGAEYPAGLGSLVSKFLGRTPPKHETRTDWRRRPLSKRQVEYALNDARYLPPLRDAIHKKLDDFGRLAWLEEEMESWRKSVQLSLSQERWRRVSGGAGLDGRGLAIVRELFHWRDAEAQRRNQPSRRILRDDLIVELARRGSADPNRIQAVRGLERGDLRRRMGELAAAVQRGLDLPEGDCPPQASREHAPELSVLGQFLFAALGSVCRQAELAPNLVGTPGDIRQWMAYRTGHRRRGRRKRG